VGRVQVTLGGGTSEFTKASQAVLVEQPSDGRGAAGAERVHRLGQAVADRHEPVEVGDRSFTDGAGVYVWHR
jgi:hypothetical protein